MSVAASDVLWILETLRGLDVTIGGGWGVDALWGTQTRDHSDLDLYLPESGLRIATDRLGQAGFGEEVDWLPGRLVVVDGSERRVDLHPYQPRPDGSGFYTTHTGDTLVFPAEAFASGRIGDQVVPCWSVEFQIQVHTGYEPSESDLHDLELLDRLSSR